MANTPDINISKIRTFSWLKYVQYVILIAVGGIFSFYHLSLFDNPEEVFRGLALFLGIAFIIYGLLTLISGYVIYKSPFSQNVILGVAFIAIAFVLILKSSVVYSLFAVITVVCLFAFAFLLFVHIFYLIKTRKKRKSSGLLVFFSFLGAAACAGLGGAYLFINDNLVDKFEGLTGGERMIGIIIGILLIFIGFVSIIVTAINSKNSKKLFASAASSKKETASYQSNANHSFSSTPNNTQSSFNYSSFQSRNTNQNNSSFSYNKSRTDSTFNGFAKASPSSSSPFNDNSNNSNEEIEPEIIDIRPKD